MNSDDPSWMRAAIESVVIPALLPLIPLMIQRLRKHLAEEATDA